MPFDYGALIGDVRVIWPNGRSADVLRKLHYVGPRMIVGFAGSVELGFAMIDDMQRVFRPPEEDFVWFPKIAAWRWRRRGRRIFAQAPDELRRLGCSLILVGVSAEPSGFIGTHSSCVLIQAPDFYPRVIRRNRWASIGTGSEHVVAKELASVWEENFFPYWQMEQAGLGGAAWGVAQNVTMDLLKQPLLGVSEVVITGVVSISKLQIAGSRMVVNFGEHDQREIRAGALIGAWGDFVEYCESNSLQAAGAAA